MDCASFPPTVSDFFFLQLLIFVKAAVVGQGMMQKLMKANAHLNTESRVYMPIFSHTPWQVILSSKKQDTHNSYLENTTGGQFTKF